MKKLLQNASIAAALTLATGCASVFSDHSYQVHVVNNYADRFEVVDVSTKQIVYSGTASHSHLRILQQIFRKSTIRRIFIKKMKKLSIATSQLRSIR